MKFDEGDQAGGVEDRRGGGITGMHVGGGLGVIGMIVVVVYRLLSGDSHGAAEVVLDGVQQQQGRPTRRRPRRCPPSAGAARG